MRPLHLRRVSLRWTDVACANCIYRERNPDPGRHAGRRLLTGENDITANVRTIARRCRLSAAGSESLAAVPSLLEVRGEIFIHARWL